MKVLHNRFSNKELKRLMLEEKEPRVTISFYKYFHLDDPQQFRDELYIKFYEIDVFGRVYIASEGINGQISVPESKKNTFKEILYNAHPQLNGIRLNEALDNDGKSFWVLRMKVRKKIVADGIDDQTFDPSKTGKYLTAKEFNKLSDQADTIVVDMRNSYEYEVGHFNNAIEIPSVTFRDQLPMAVDMLQNHKDKNIIMYCTGGIRCEKASAYMLHNGFKNVYHVEGGIIEYVRKAREESLPVKFIGKNFVFDERLGERVTDDVIAKCYQCGEPSDRHTNCANQECHDLIIQCERCAKEYNGCCTQECKQH
ncbi:MAG: rhodanese-related sulfurtransferase [Fermentimonas sp.]|nr:rhodanese-related sulfurtransferase [Fermentimonas sp.]MDD4697695.1 rhodanese-related sulfurtransferase [Fermentimonas sp.]